jgi:diguanylate cyclase
MIGILRETANLLAGESTGFGMRIRSTTDRFRAIAELDDIRELKKQLTEEASLLQQTVASKLQRDQQAVSALTERVQALEAHLVEAEEEASLDPLTRIANRGRFDRSVTRMAKSARGANRPMSLVLVDIDHFKRINDEHGHTIGDRVLLCAAQWLTGAVRHNDLVARYGGEEFAVILTDADLTAAEARFRAVAEQIANRSFEYDLNGETHLIRFTVSCGVAQLTGSDTEADLIRRADDALYAAKRGGRNRVVARKRSMLSGLLG